LGAATLIIAAVLFGIWFLARRIRRAAKKLRPV